MLALLRICVLHKVGYQDIAVVEQSVAGNPFTIRVDNDIYARYVVLNSSSGSGSNRISKSMHQASMP